MLDGKKGTINIDFSGIRQKVKAGVYDPSSTEELAMSLADKLKNKMSSQKRAERLMTSLQHQKIEKLRKTIAEEVLPSPRKSARATKMRKLSQFDIPESPRAEEVLDDDHAAKSPSSIASSEGKYLNSPVASSAESRSPCARRTLATAAMYLPPPVHNVVARFSAPSGAQIASCQLEHCGHCAAAVEVRDRTVSCGAVPRHPPINALMRLSPGESIAGGSDVPATSRSIGFEGAPRCEEGESIGDMCVTRPSSARTESRSGRCFSAGSGFVQEHGNPSDDFVAGVHPLMLPLHMGRSAPSGREASFDPLGQRGRNTLYGPGIDSAYRGDVPAQQEPFPGDREMAPPDYELAYQLRGGVDDVPLPLRADHDGRPLPPMSEHDGMPLPLLTDHDGRLMSPMTDYDGRLISPMGHYDGRPLPPMGDYDGRLMSPMTDYDGRFISPMGHYDGRLGSPMDEFEYDRISIPPLNMYDGMPMHPMNEYDGMPMDMDDEMSPLPMEYEIQKEIKDLERKIKMKKKVLERQVAQRHSVVPVEDSKRDKFVSPRIHSQRHHSSPTENGSSTWRASSKRHSHKRMMSLQSTCSVADRIGHFGTSSRTTRKSFSKKPSFRSQTSFGKTGRAGGPPSSSESTTYPSSSSDAVSVRDSHDSTSVTATDRRGDVGSPQHAGSPWPPTTRYVGRQWAPPSAAMCRDPNNTRNAVASDAGARDPVLGRERSPHLQHISEGDNFDRRGTSTASVCSAEYLSDAQRSSDQEDASQQLSTMTPAARARWEKLKKKRAERRERRNKKRAEKNAWAQETEKCKEPKRRFPKKNDVSPEEGTATSRSGSGVLMLQRTDTSRLRPLGLRKRLSSLIDSSTSRRSQPTFGEPPCTEYFNLTTTDDFGDDAQSFCSLENLYNDAAFRFGQNSRVSRTSGIQSPCSSPAQRRVRASTNLSSCPETPPTMTVLRSETPPSSPPPSPSRPSRASVRRAAPLHSAEKKSSHAERSPCGERTYPAPWPLQPRRPTPVFTNEDATTQQPRSDEENPPTMNASSSGSVALCTPSDRFTIVLTPPATEEGKKSAIVENAAREYVGALSVPRCGEVQCDHDQEQDATSEAELSVMSEHAQDDVASFLQNESMDEHDGVTVAAQRAVNEALEGALMALHAAPEYEAAAPHEHIMDAQDAEAFIAQCAVHEAVESALALVFESQEEDIELEDRNAEDRCTEKDDMEEFLSASANGEDANLDEVAEFEGITLVRSQGTDNLGFVERSDTLLYDVSDSAMSSRNASAVECGHSADSTGVVDAENEREEEDMWMEVEDVWVEAEEADGDGVEVVAVDGRTEAATDDMREEDMAAGECNRTSQSAFCGSQKMLQRTRGRCDLDALENEQISSGTLLFDVPEDGMCSSNASAIDGARDAASTGVIHTENAPEDEDMWMEVEDAWTEAEEADGDVEEVIVGGCRTEATEDDMPKEDVAAGEYDRATQATFCGKQMMLQRSRGSYDLDALQNEQRSYTTLLFDVPEDAICSLSAPAIDDPDDAALTGEKDAENAREEEGMWMEVEDAWMEPEEADGEHGAAVDRRTDAVEDDRRGKKASSEFDTTGETGFCGNPMLQRMRGRYDLDALEDNCSDAAETVDRLGRWESAQGAKHGARCAGNAGGDGARTVASASTEVSLEMDACAVMPVSGHAHPKVEDSVSHLVAAEDVHGTESKQSSIQGGCAPEGGHLEVREVDQGTRLEEKQVEMGMAPVLINLLEVTEEQTTDYESRFLGSGSSSGRLNDVEQRFPSIDEFCALGKKDRISTMCSTFAGSSATDFSIGSSVSRAQRQTWGPRFQKIRNFFLQLTENARGLSTEFSSGEMEEWTPN